ncbi:MAG TPA: endonuclease III [Candidatus Nanoarchaeia archaeon]|nr:endonuclease III [Candidatus Nanoarchaeia archaeon]
MQNIDTIIKILKANHKTFKKPIVTEISEERNPFKVLISCLLSLRTRDEVTEKASLRLFNIADKPEELLKLSNKKIESLIYPVSFYKVKTKRIKEICNVLINKYNSKVPNTLEELLKLKGVGRKTAAITLVYGFGIDNYIPVDVHVHVMANRLGWVKTKNADETMDALMKVIHKKYWYDLNDLLVAYGQNICLTRSPICSKCKIAKFCPRIGVTQSR